MEGEAVWIDRPGLGENNLGLSQSFISRHPIDYLGSGAPYSDSLKQALRSSGAVLGCLSRAMTEDKDVIIGELTVASTLDKLAACIVDDLAFEDLPDLTRGLFDASRLQAPRIDTAALRRAVERRQQTGCAVAELPEDEAEAWETILGLISSINTKRTEPRRMRPVDVERLVKIIDATPIGPILPVNALPRELWFTFADHIDTRDRANLLIQQANLILSEAERDPDLVSGLSIRRGALPAIGTLSGDDYWTRVFTLAGQKSRKTVAALLSVPVADWAFDQSGHAETRDRFVEFLQRDAVR